MISFYLVIGGCIFAVGFLWYIYNKAKKMAKQELAIKNLTKTVNETKNVKKINDKVDSADDSDIRKCMRKYVRNKNK